MYKKKKIVSPFGHSRVSCKEDQGGSYFKGEEGATASFRGRIKAKKLVLKPDQYP